MIKTSGKKVSLLEVRNDLYCVKTPKTTCGNLDKTTLLKGGESVPLGSGATAKYEASGSSGSYLVKRCA
jgi:hypothetical protein